MPEGAPSAPVGLIVAWRRDVPDYAFMEHYSQQHIVRVVGGRENPHTLCGALPRWGYISQGDGSRCRRCFAAAEKAAMVNEDGQLLTSEYA